MDGIAVDELVIAMVSYFRWKQAKWKLKLDNTIPQ